MDRDYAKAMIDASNRKARRELDSMYGLIALAWLATLASPFIVVWLLK